MFSKIGMKLFCFIITLIFLFTTDCILAQTAKLTISGTIKDNQSRPMLGVIVYLRSNLDPNSWTEDKSITDSDGTYRFDNLVPGMTHLITPLKSGYNFVPSTAKFENLMANKVQNFSAEIIVVKKYSINGYVKDNNSVPIKDVVMLLNGKTVIESVNMRVVTDNNGFYKFDQLDSLGYYYITPSKEKYVFTPTNKIFDALHENKTQEFTGIQLTASEFNISGYIKDKNSKPVIGVTVSLAGAPFMSKYYAQVRTDSTGLYKFEKLESGLTYTLFPSKEGYLFDPASKTYEILDENKKQDFLAKIDDSPKLTISGYVKDINSHGISNVTMRLNGIVLSSVSLIASTDSLGYYKFSNLRYSIGYYLSPFKQGYTFNPTGQPFDSLKENKMQDFVGTKLPENITISGYIKDKDSNPIEGVIVYLGSSMAGEYKTLTDANGFYKFEKLMAGQSIKMFVSKDAYTFNPPSAFFENIIENKIQNFTGKKLITYYITGFVTDKNKAGVAGVSLTLSGGKYDMTFSDSTGYYKFNLVEEGRNYVITPTKRRYNFDPKSVNFDNLTKNMTQNFTGTALPVINYTISGYVKDKNSLGIEGVTLSLISDGALAGIMGDIRILPEKQLFSVKTNSSGFYKFENVESGTYYILSAEKTGYSFTPNCAIFKDLNENKTSDFTGTPVQLYSISGYIKDKDSKGINEVMIILGGEKQVQSSTDINGFYKLENIESGKYYNIIPLKKGYRFEPNYKIFENFNENKKQDFTGTEAPTLTLPICGFIGDKDNVRLGNVTVVLNGDTELTTQTDENGFFEFDNLAEGKNYVVTPIKQGYDFYPPNISLNNLTDSKALNSIGAQNVTTNVTQNRALLIKDIKLLPNYPNPFNPVTTIEYEINTSSVVKLKVYNILGIEVCTLMDGYQYPGSYKYQFDAKNISSGMYIVRLQAGNTVKSMAITLLK